MDDVIFRVDDAGDVFAFFPYVVFDSQGFIAFFSPKEGWSGADYDWCIENSRPAKPSEYEKLLAFLSEDGSQYRVIKYADRRRILRNKIKAIKKYWSQHLVSRNL
jgi:hypothetical protein